MGDTEWDADNFQPSSFHVGDDDNRWEGEDEDDNIKDSWDKDSEPEETEEAPKATETKKKKKIGEILAEKEEARLEAKRAAAEKTAEEEYANTPEGKAIEKLRLLKLEESNNLQLTKELYGLSTGTVDSMIPVSKEDFANFDRALTEKIFAFASSEHYSEFIDEFIKNLCLDLNAATLKKIKMNVEALHSTKLKEEKSAKSKKKGKGGNIKMDLTKDLFSDRVIDDYDDMDGFM